jgi:hypothetical protein
MKSLTVHAGVAVAGALAFAGSDVYAPSALRSTILPLVALLALLYLTALAALLLARWSMRRHASSAPSAPDRGGGDAYVPIFVDPGGPGADSAADCSADSGADGGGADGGTE